MTTPLTGIDAIDALMLSTQAEAAWNVAPTHVIITTDDGTLEIRATYTGPPDDGYPCLKVTWTPRNE